MNLFLAEFAAVLPEDTHAVLVLNRAYLPIHITSVRRACSLLYQGIARAVDAQYQTFDFESWSALSAELHGDKIGLVDRALRVPRVILLVGYDRIPKRHVRFSRFNVYARDRNTCQYCGVVLPSSELTLDHVIPRSRGGNSTWENLVACCHGCNRRKGNRLLHEIDDMQLMRDPRPFSLHTSRQIMRMLGRGDDRWRKYLFY